MLLDVYWRLYRGRHCRSMPKRKSEVSHELSHCVYCARNVVDYWPALVVL